MTKSVIFTGSVDRKRDNILLAINDGPLLQVKLELERLSRLGKK